MSSYHYASCSIRESVDGLGLVDDDATVDPVEASFQRDILADVAQMQRELSYNPKVFLRMVGDHGAVEACRRLVNAPDGSDGFTKLWQAGRLGMTVEAYVLRPWFADLFTDDDRDKARDRLERYEFDVDAYLDRLRREPPDWWQSG